jgi:streptomycin 6-kinase
LDLPETFKKTIIGVHGKKGIEWLRTLSEVLTLPRERILGWVCSFAVLSAWWSYEDSTGSWEEGIALAEVVSRCA